MTEQLVWVLEITDPGSGTCTVHHARDEVAAREFAKARAEPGQELLLRRGARGPVVDIWTASGAGPATRVEVAPTRHHIEPARNKLEAVSRLGRLNGGPPESLGPGSKERKSVLINLAKRLQLEFSPGLTKPELGARLAASLGTTWDASCWSTGSTLTLEGLNRLLLAAEAKLSQAPSSGFQDSPEVEGARLLEVLATSLPPRLKGRSALSRCGRLSSANGRRMSGRASTSSFWAYPR